MPMRVFRACRFRVLPYCLLLAGCFNERTTDPSKDLPAQAKLTARVSSSVEIFRGGERASLQLVPNTSETWLSGTMKHGQFHLERREGPSANRSGLQAITTYPLADSTMADILPPLAFSSAGYSPPSGSEVFDSTYTSEDSHVMLIGETFGSVGQPLVGVMNVDGVTEYKETLTWTSTSEGVALNRAKYEVYEPVSDVLVRMTAIVDSMQVTILTEGLPPITVPRVLLAGIGPQNLLPATGTLSVRAVILSVLFSACSTAKVDLWLARGWLAAGTAAFAAAPAPPTFLAFAVSVANVSVARKRMLTACKN